MTQPDNETFALLLTRFGVEHPDLNFMDAELADAVTTIIRGSLPDHPGEWPAAAFTMGWLCARDYEAGKAMEATFGDAGADS